LYFVDYLSLSKFILKKLF